MRVLIVKHGALGDVVRTSYFASALRKQHGTGLELWWITAASAAPLLRFNPDIDHLVTRFSDLPSAEFDTVFSLDDEMEVVAAVMAVPARRRVGALLDERGERRYSDDSAPWFDMGLLSRFGKARADELKKLNRLGHAQLMSMLFGVPVPSPSFHGNARIEAQVREELRQRFGERPIVGINPFAGGRWRSKELPRPELQALVRHFAGKGLGVALIGAGPDRQRNLEVIDPALADRVAALDTDASVLQLAASVRCLRFLVSSDSLAMHLAIAQHVPTVAFFSPTSAPEIDDFGRVEKVLSLSPDYCSYRPDADNSTITAARLLEAVERLHVA